MMRWQVTIRDTSATTIYDQEADGAAQAIRDAIRRHPIPLGVTLYHADISVAQRPHAP